MICGCTADRGMGRLTELLYSDYCAEINFVLSDGTSKLEGTANVQKSDSVKISFLSPAELSGMTVESGADGQSGNLFFNYYGMKVPLPQNALTKLNIALSCFSDETALALESLPKKEISDVLYDSSNGSINAKTCCFKTAGDSISARMTYDSLSGVPLEFSGSDGVFTAEIYFKKISNP